MRVTPKGTIEDLQQVIGDSVNGYILHTVPILKLWILIQEEIFDMYSVLRSGISCVKICNVKIISRTRQYQIGCLRWF